MLKSQTIPIWMQPTTLEDWPTQVMGSSSLRYSLPICLRWCLKPSLNQTPMEQEHLFQGALPGELLTVSFMEQVNPNHDLRNWIQAFIQLTGLPILYLKDCIKPSPALIAWEPMGASLQLAKQLQADDIFLFQGLAQLSEASPAFIRLYTLLVRRQTQAWKISLALRSACSPDMPKELVERNDHLRAGATLGHLQLF